MGDSGRERYLLTVRAQALLSADDRSADTSRQWRRGWAGQAGVEALSQHRANEPAREGVHSGHGVRSAWAETLSCLWGRAQAAREGLGSLCTGTMT